MPAAAKHSPRPYLPASARRDHLLAVAAGMVRTGGWAALSMQGLAIAAGVSRQLVYDHFATADELSLETLTHLFERAQASTAAIALAGTTVTDTARAAFELFLDLPPEERQALRSLAAEVEPGRRGLSTARRRLRNRIASVWMPYVRQRTGISEAEATALAWMINTAAWGLSDTVSDGTLDRHRAVALFVQFVEGTLSTFDTRGNPR